MGFFDSFPYSNQHTLNLDWVIQTVKTISDRYPGDMKALTNKIMKLAADVEKLSAEIDSKDYDYISELFDKYLAAMIFPEITDAGYIVYNIPESWDNITFNTTGIDIDISIQPEYGHLVLSY